MPLRSATRLRATRGCGAQAGARRDALASSDAMLPVT